MSKPGPLTLDPIVVPKPWGGKRLRDLGKVPVPHPTPGIRYGESWEVADLPNNVLSASLRGRTPVAHGPHRGKTLRDLIAELGPALLGSASPTPAGDFPLLVKLLDTAEHLSIQVHPGKHYASRRSDWLPKTESWYVLDTEPGAVIFKGFRPGVDMETVRAAAGTPALVGLLRRVSVRRGEFHHLPSGTVHALGAGVTVAEVQTPSDTTFRLYDWTEEYDRPPRRLQVPAALESLSLDPPGASCHPPMETEGDRLLVNSPHYWIREHRVTGRPIALRDTPELRILAVARGHVEVRAGFESCVDLGPGSTVSIPAMIVRRTRVTASDAATLLEIGLISDDTLKNSIV